MTKGDVANVTGDSEAKNAAPKETKKKKATTTTKTAAATRPKRTTRGRSASARPKDEAETSKPAARASSKAAKKKDAGDKKATTKEAGVKRENNSKPAARRSKRSKTSDAASATIFEPRTTRSRSASRRRSEIVKEVESRKAAEVKIITDPKYIVPRDFRLHRESFDGTNFTEGIAHYDAARRADPQNVTEYITDLFQHLYKAEVRFLFVICWCGLFMLC